MSYVYHLLPLATVLMTVAACSTVEQANPDLDSQGKSKRAVALFDLEKQQKLPWPNAAAQRTETVAGKLVITGLAIPNPDGNPIVTEVNAQSGFTRLPVITADFSADISVATIRPGKNLICMGSNSDGSAIDQVDVDVRFDSDRKKLYLYPRKPLQPDFDYAIILTKSIQGANGLPIQEDLYFRFTKYKQPLFDEKTGTILSDLLASSGISTSDAARLEMLRKAYQDNFFGPKAKLKPFVRSDFMNTHKEEAVKLDPVALDAAIVDHIAVAWAFHTAKEDPTEALRTARLRLTSSSADPVISTMAGVITYPAGTVLDEYYRSHGITWPNDRIWLLAEGKLKSLSFFTDVTWPTPLSTGTLWDVPVIVAYPREAATAPVPVVLFQHGLTSCKRVAVLGVANALAAQGLAVIGIDAVEHGERAVTNGDTSNDAEAPGPCDNVIAGKLVKSGEGFFRLDSIGTVRDILRQTVADQVALAHGIVEKRIGIVHGSSGDFTQIYFSGQSFGAVTGAMFLGIEDRVRTGALSVGGAWLSRVLVESPEFYQMLAPKVAAALNAGPVTSEAFQDLFAKFVPLVQGLLDPADPAFFVADLAANHRVLIQKVASDEVMPNTTTDYLAALAGVATVSSAQVANGGLSAMTEWVGATHGALLHPVNPSITARMQEQLAVFLASDGTQLVFP